MIELDTRRRLKINGDIVKIDATEIVIAVRESFPLCPKYIQRRKVRLPADLDTDASEKGLPVVIKGRLEQRSWEDKETGQKRSTVEVIADTIAVNSYGIASLERQRGGASGGGGQRVQNQPTPAGAGAAFPSSDPFEDF